MNWGGVNEFFAMGGYALYVWGSYSVTALALALEILALRARRQRALTELPRAPLSNTTP